MVFETGFGLKVTVRGGLGRLCSCAARPEVDEALDVVEASKGELSVASLVMMVSHGVDEFGMSRDRDPPLCYNGAP